MSDQKLEECTGCIGSTEEHTCEGWAEFQEMKAARENPRTVSAEYVNGLLATIERLTEALDGARASVNYYLKHVEQLNAEVAGLCKIIDYARGGILELSVLAEISKRVEALAATDTEDK